jgi:uncharacterized protein (TIGR02145 family)
MKTSNGTGTGIFSSKLSLMTPHTTYYVRAYATNSAGTAYGNEMSFTTDPATVTDIEGNIYNLVRIGNQLWMAENLKTTKYNDGLAIPVETVDTLWNILTTPAYGWYNNSAANKDTYGALYNWYAVNTTRLCPAGWHVPTDAEWTILTTYLGGASVAGGKLKETGLSHWISPNTGATNVSGFTGLPGGLRRSFTGAFDAVGYTGAWWSDTQVDASRAWGRGLDYYYYDIQRPAADKVMGYSVRCVRDF